MKKNLVLPKGPHFCQPSAEARNEAAHRVAKLSSSADKMNKLAWDYILLRFLKGKVEEPISSNHKIFYSQLLQISQLYYLLYISLVFPLIILPSFLGKRSLDILTKYFKYTNKYKQVFVTTFVLYILHAYCKISF